MTTRFVATQAKWKAISVHVLTLFVCAAGFADEPFSLVPTSIRAEIRTAPIKQDLTDEYRVKVWNSTHGLPQNHVDTVARDRQGYLWLSTWVGLSRFNGREFVNFNPVNTPAIRNETFSGLLTDRAGDLWATSKDGLYRIDGTKFERFGTEHGLTSADILSLEEDRSGNKWLATANGLVRFDGTNVATFTPDAEHRLTQNIHFLPDGQSLVFTAGGSSSRNYSFDPTTGRFDPLPPQFAPAGAVVRRELAGPDREGVLWFRTEGAIYHLGADGGVKKWREVPETMKSERILLLADSRGDVWLAGETPGVLERHSRGRLSKLDLGASAQITSFNSLIEEPDGLLWLCTGQGLVQLKARTVQNIGRRQGLLHDFIFSVAGMGRGRALLGTSRWPALVDLEQMTISLHLLPGVNTTSRSLLPNADGSYWLTDGEHGPTHVALDGTVSRTTLTTNWPYRSEQYVYYRDSQERLWIGGETNLYIVQSNRTVRIINQSPHSIPADGVRVIREMSDHSIWLGGKGTGITVLAPDANTVLDRITTTNGLSHDDVWALETDERGDVWAGTANGLNRIRQRRCQKLLREDGLSEGVINQILRDHYGYFWLTGLKGVYRVDPRQMSEHLDGKTEEIQVLSITDDDGLANAETNGEQQPAGFVDERGQLWIPTIAGVAVIDPSRFRLSQKPERPFVEKIEFDGEVLFDNGPGSEGKISLDQVFSLPAGGGQLLEIHFAAPHVELAGAATYEVRLNGHDESWRDVERQTSIIYPTLRPGDYSFDVRVANHHRQTSNRSTEFRFHIAAYPYQLWSFWALVAGLAAAAGYFLHRRRLAIVSHVQELEQREALVADRERIARDMHDDLGSRLTHISLLADLSKRANERPDALKLDELNLAARDAARAVEEIVWSANPGNDTIASLVAYMIQHAENVFSAAAIACRVDAALDWPELYLAPEARHSTFMAFKESIHNIVKHAGAPEVRLAIQPQGTDVHVRIADNGRGFDLERKRISEEDGLRNMAARMAKIGGQFSIRSSPGNGTVVELFFPMPGPTPKGARPAR